MTSLKSCLHTLLWLLPLALLAGCTARGDATRPVPTRFVPAIQPARRTVVFLPGRGDDLAGLQRHHAAQLIQQVWPDANVILTGLTMPYYTSGVASQRLHDEVIAPLEKQGHRPVWIAGISLGGMGALLYDDAYPGEVDGLLLLSPYLGDKSIHEQIRAAGGIQRWQAGPKQAIGPDTFQRELWRSIQQWEQEPARANSVWLAYGDSERFRGAIEQMSPLLPNAHVLMLPGHHNWKLWSKTLPALLHKAGHATATSHP
jgi:pimeloyl-ACP methyl ester carboxylesterase